jgi:hypothetical protein
MENFSEFSESSAWEGFSDAGIDEPESDSGANNGSSAATSDAGIDEPELDSGTNNGSNAATESATMNLEPPPETEHYDTYQQLLAAVNNWALRQGYAVTSKRTIKSRRGKGELCKVYLQCDRGGRHRDQSSGIRSCGSRRIECPFCYETKTDLL